MPILALLLAASAPVASQSLPPCRPAQLRLSLDGRDSDWNGMSHSGVELSIRNVGGDCRLPGLPTLELLDTHGRVLPASRQVPVGMHPGPVILPVRLAGGHRATTELRWVSGPVFPQNCSVRAAGVRVRIGKAPVRAPLKAVLYGKAGKLVHLEQTVLQAADGMAAG